jgi:hypothetical protein
VPRRRRYPLSEKAGAIRVVLEITPFRWKGYIAVPPEAHPKKLIQNLGVNI